MIRLLFRYQALFIALITMTLINSCRKKVDPIPATTLAVLDSGQLIYNQDLTATSFRMTSLLVSAGNQAIVTVGHLCSITNPKPTLTDNDAFSAAAVRVGTLPYRFTTVVSALQPATRYYARAYVTNSVGTSYGPTVQFSTFAKQKTVYATLAKLLDDSLRPKDVGYAFTIYQGATLMASGAGGLAARSMEPEGNTSYTIDTKMHVASISKTITAFTLVALAAQKGLSLSAPIAPYLPRNWPQGPNVNRITFNDLLTHQSGISSSVTNCQGGPLAQNEYAFLKQTIAEGVTAYGQYCYQNANYALLRVLIPAIMGYRFLADDPIDTENTSSLYRQAVNSLVFDPVGLPGISVKQPLGQPTYLYSYPYQSSRGYLTGDFSGTVGAVGWYLTAAETGKLVATVLSSADQSVLASPSKAILLGNRLGCFAGLLGDQTTVYYHDGGQWEPDPSLLGTYRGLRTVWMKYPDEVTIVLFTNAINNNRLFPSTTGIDIVDYVNRAYNRARQIQNGRTGYASLQLEHAGPH